MTPSPLYPALHVQVKLPSVFSQSALSSQVSPSEMHSLISEIRQTVMI